jgi:hypothetical protein
MQTVTLGELRKAAPTVDAKTDHGQAIINTVKAHEGYGDEFKLPVHNKIAEACQTSTTPVPNSLNLASESLSSEVPSGPTTPAEFGTSELV